MTPSAAIGAIILAAGASRRMGRNKLLDRWNDDTILGHAIALARCAARQILVVHRPDATALEGEWGRLNIRPAERLPNPLADATGMIGSLRLGIASTTWNADVRLLLVLPADMPSIRKETVRALASYALQEPDRCWRPVLDPAVEGLPADPGHPVILPMAAALCLLEDRWQSLRHYLDVSKAPQSTFPTDDTGIHLDLDIPADYDRLVHPRGKLPEIFLARASEG